MSLLVSCGDHNSRGKPDFGWTGADKVGLFVVGGTVPEGLFGDTLVGDTLFQLGIRVSRGEVGEAEGKRFEVVPEAETGAAPLAFQSHPGQRNTYRVELDKVLGL